jgi:hypothetical protein
LISAEDRLLKLEFCRQGRTTLPTGNYTGYNQKLFYTPPSERDAPLVPCFSLPWEGEIAALDAAGSLFRLCALKGEAKSIGGKPIVGTVHLIATDVLAVASWDARLVYVGREWPGNNTFIVSVGTDITRMAIPFEGEARRAFFGPRSSVGHEKFGLLAIEQNEFQWAIVTARGERVLVRPNAAKVVGVLTDGTEPGLLALESDGRTLALHGRNWRKKILEANSTIDRVSVSQVLPYIAYSTINGEIVVYSLTHRADLCRYQTEARS